MMNDNKQQIKTTGMNLGLIVTLTAISIGSGCTTSGNTAGDFAQERSLYVQVDDPTFYDQVSVTSVSHEYRGDLMRALVTLESHRHRSLWMQYKFSWYDRNGTEIDPGSKPYKSLTLEGLDSASLTSMAPNARATEFKIRIRKIKPLKMKNLF